jgi:hypothetical protein
MGLQEIRPDELDISEGPMVHINLNLFGGNEENESDERGDRKGRASDVDVQPIHNVPVGEKDEWGGEEKEGIEIRKASGE